MKTKRKPMLPGSIQMQPMQEAKITTHFGIAPDAKRVMMVFSEPVPNMILTVEKAEEWCRNIQGVIAAIKAQSTEPPANHNG